MVVLLPLHNVGLLTEAMATVGVVFTLIVVLAELPLGQFTLLIPVSVYCVVVAGLTTKLVPVNAPGFKVYVEAPLGVIVALLLLHKVGLVTEAMATVGVAYTLIIVLTEFPPGQLAPLVPVSVYCVVVAGVTTNWFRLTLPDLKYR